MNHNAKSYVSFSSSTLLIICGVILSMSVLLASCKNSNEPALSPVINSFTPGRGPAGSTITIAGQAFGSTLADIEVTVGTVPATVITAKPNQLTVLVPAAATGGKISVSVHGLILQSITDFTVTDRWETRGEIGGKRDFGFSFSTNGKGYVGGGSLSQIDFWEYDPVTDAWTQKQDFKGEPRVYATGLGVAGKGYVMCGLGGSETLKDVWEYDPGNNNWTQKNDLTFSERFAAIGFAIGSKGYVGTGVLNSSTALNDFWEYNPAPDSWTKKADLPGDARAFSFGFAIGSKGYIGGGETRPGDLPAQTFYEYDLNLDQWSQKSSSPQATDFSFLSNSFASATSGYVSGTNGIQLWRYDPASDVWTRKTNPPSQVVGVGFTIGDYGFLGSSYDKTFYRYIFD